MIYGHYPTRQSFRAGCVQAVPIIRLKHQLAYLEGWEPPTISAALTKGKLWHNVLESHYNRLVELRQQEGWKDKHEIPGGLLHPNQIEEHPTGHLLLQAVDPWLYGGPRGNQQGEYQELVEWMWRGHVAYYGSDPDWNIKAVEYEASVRLKTPRGGWSSFVVRMKADLVIKLDGRLWLVDHKSGRDLPRDKDLDMADQFGLYTWLLRQVGKPIFGSLHNAARTQKNKDSSITAQPLDKRFARTRLHRTDTELEEIAAETYELMREAYAPRQREYAPRSPNEQTCVWRCLPGDTSIDYANVLGASRRLHTGPLVTIRTANGRCLTGTPEHPVLTTQGWVSFGALIEGMDVLCDGRLQAPRNALVGNDVDHRPASIEEVFDTTLDGRTPERVPSRSSKFYGERPATEIEVIWADRQLTRVGLAQPSRQLILSGTYNDAAGLALPSDQRSSLRGSSSGNTARVQDALDVGAFDAVLFRQAIDRLTGQESPSNLIPSGGTFSHRGGTDAGLEEALALADRSSEILDACSLRKGAERDIEISEHLAQGPVGVSGTAGQFTQRLSGLITSDQVVRIDRHGGSSWVFDLSTVDGWFTAEGIITHNCPYTEACLFGRKGNDLRGMLRDLGFTQQLEGRWDYYESDKPTGEVL